jgi:hypothetical protein
MEKSPDANVVLVGMSFLHSTCAVQSVFTHISHFSVTFDSKFHIVACCMLAVGGWSWCDHSGNKSDLTQQREVSEEEGLELSTRSDILLAPHPPYNTITLWHVEWCP